jgi:hypothetical protein
MPTSPGSLEADIERDLQRHARSATAAARAASVLSAAAILSSIAAAISVAGQWLAREWLVVLSAAAAMLLVIVDRFRLEERAEWHDRRTRELRALLYQLRYEAAPEREISIQWRHLTGDVERRGSPFGKGRW